MTQRMFRYTLHKTTVLLAIAVISFLLLGHENVKGQACPEVTTGKTIGIHDVMGQCAPITTWVFGRFNISIALSCPAIDVDKFYFNVNWGDGGSTLNIAPTKVTQTGSDLYAKYYTIEFNDPAGTDKDTSFRYKYDVGEYACMFKIEVILKHYDITGFQTDQETTMQTYHQTEDYSGAKSLILANTADGKDIFYVCVGQEQCIQFEDLSEPNCNPALDPIPAYALNSIPRRIEFEYGIKGAFGSDNNIIPGVTVTDDTNTRIPVTNGSGGLFGSGTYSDGGAGTHRGDHYIHSSRGESGLLTSEICIPGTTTIADVGKRFYLKMKKWNKCNPYPGVPTEKEAIIELVAAPPKPDDQTLSFCNAIGNNYKTSDYLITLVHNTNGMNNGTYYWFLDDGTGTGPASTDPNDAIHSSKQKNDFNPANSSKFSGQSYLDRNKAQKKIYWVVYSFNSPGYNVTCTSDPAKIVYEIREDISAAPVPKSWPLAGCSGDKITLQLPRPKTFTIGGAIEYVWKVDAPNTLTVINDSTAIVELKPVTAPSTGTATVEVYRKWKSQVTNPPATCSMSTGCSYCPSNLHIHSITINPLPVATIKGGGTICAGDSLALTVSGFIGASGSVSFDIHVKNAQPILGHNSSTNAMIYVNPPAGTTGWYKITSLRDVATGCVNTGLKDSVKIVKLPALNIPGPVNGPDSICEGAGSTYSLPAPAASTKYQWGVTGDGAVTSTSSTSVTVKANAMPAGSVTTNSINVSVYQEYTSAPLCPSNTITRKVTVMPVPYASINSTTLNQTLCPGAATIKVDLTGTPDLKWTVKWSLLNPANVPVGGSTETVNGSASGARTHTIPIPAAILTSPGKYTFRIDAVSQACTGKLGTPSATNITILKQPTATIGGNITVCEGTDVDIPVTLTGELMGVATGKYTVRYTVGGGTPETVDFYTTIAANTQLHIPYTKINQAHNATTVVTVIGVTEDNGTMVFCPNNATSSFTITNEANPNKANAGPGVSTCVGALPANYQLGATPPTAPYSGQWKVVASPCPVSLSSLTDHDASFSINPACRGRYVFEWTVSGGVCAPTKDTVVLDWAVTPGVPQAGPDDSFCYVIPGDPDTQAGYKLNGNNPVPSREKGQWVLKSGPGTVKFDNPENPKATVKVSVYGSYTFTWEFSNACGANTDDVVITFIETPRLNHIPAQDWCPKQPNTMPAFVSTVANSTFKWAFTGTAMPSYPASGNGQFPAQATPDNTNSSSVPYKLKITVTDQGAVCSSDTTIDINLKPRPQAAATSGTLCINDLITFSLIKNLGDSVTYQWTNTNPAIHSLTTSPVTVGHPYSYSFPATNVSGSQISGDIVLTATVNGCASDPLSATINVNPFPVFTVSPFVFCAGETVDQPMTAFTSTTSPSPSYVWTYTGDAVGIAANGTTDNLGQFNAINTGNTVKGGTVTIKASIPASIGACETTAGFPLTVKARPVINPVQNQEACPLPAGAPANSASTSFGPVTLGASIPSTYDWSVTDPSATVGSGNVFTISGLPDNMMYPAGVNYTVTVTATGNIGTAAEGCESAPVSFNLKIKPRPKIQGFNQPQEVCSGNQFESDKPGAITFSNNMSVSASYNWVNTIISGAGSTGIGSSGTATVGEIITSPSNNTGTIPLVSYLRIKATLNQCVGPPDSVRLTVNPTPEMVQPLDIEKCAGDMVPLTHYASNVAGATYTWKISDPSVGANLPLQVADTSAMRAFRTVNTGNGTKTAQVEVTGKIGACVSLPKYYNITVRPTPRVNHISDIYACPGETVKLPILSNTVSGSAGDISWSLNNPGITNPAFSPVTGTGNFNPGNVVLSANTTGADIVGVFTLSAKVNNCQGPDSTFRIVISPTPKINAVPDVSYCDGAAVPATVFSSPTPNVTFYWSRTGDDIGLLPSSGQQSVPGFTAKNSSILKQDSVIGNFSVYTQVSTCKSVPVTFKIIVKPVPRMNYANPEFCANVPTTPAPFDMLPKPGAGDVILYSWQVTSDFAESGLPAGMHTGNLPLITPDISNPATNPLYGETQNFAQLEVAPFLNGCAGEIQKVILTYNPIPVTTITLPETPCVSVTRNNKLYYADQGHGTNGSTYSWGITGGTPAAYVPSLNPTNTNQLVITYPAPHISWSGDLNVVERNVYGCFGNTVTERISVLPAPVISAGPDLEICRGDEVRMQGQLVQSSGGTIKYRWWGGYVIADGDATNALVRPLSTVNMYFEAEEDGCPSDIDTATVHVRLIPDAPALIADNFCSSDTKMVVKVSNITPGNDIRWGRISGSSFTAIPTANDSTAIDLRNPLHANALPSPITYLPPRDEAGITYGVYQVINYGTISCASDTMQGNVIIGKIPEMPIPHHTLMCKGNRSSFDISVSSAASLTYFKWYSDTTQLAIYSNSPTYTVTGITTDGTYTYYATQVGLNTCESYAVPVNLTVWPNPDIQFTISDSIGCADLPVSVTNTSSNGPNPTYHWEWDDGTPTMPSTEGGTAMHTYTNDSKVYEANPVLKLVAFNQYGCDGEKGVTMRIFPKLTADFEFDYYSNACDSADVGFRSNSTGANTYQWDFDDGHKKGPTNVNYTSHTFSNMGHVINLHRDQKTYQVKLVASKSYGGGYVCKDSITYPVLINPSPKADFDIYEKDQVTPAPAWVCAPYEIWLDNKHWTAGSPPGKGANTALTTYDWDFAMSNTGRDTTHVLQNTNAGGGSIITSRITLTAVNEYGCSNELVKTIRVLPELIPDFFAETEGCDPVDVQFQNNSKGARAYRWYWTGTTTTPPADGQPGADYSGPNAWHSFVNTSHSTPRTYRVWLQIENGSGTEKCYSNLDTVITVYPRPVVDLFHDAPTTGICPPTPVQFTNNSISRNSPLTTYTLIFGEGGAELKPWNTPTTTYSYVGGNSHVVRTAVFTAENEYFCTNDTAVSISVNPAVQAEIEPINDGCSEYETRVYSKTAAPNYVWTFTGASSPTSTTTANGMNPAVKFVNASHNTVDVVVVKLRTSNAYCFAEDTTSFKLFPAPAANFTMDVSQGCQPLRVEFTNSSTGNPGANTEYIFTFESGASTPVAFLPKKEIYTYKNLDNANLDQFPTLSVKNQWGCVSTHQEKVTLFPLVIADFTMSPTEGCSPLEIDFTNKSRGYTTSDWRMDGVHFSSVMNPKKQKFYNSDMVTDKSYQITLVVGNGQCQNDTTQTIIVYGTPVADFTASPMTQFYPGTVVNLTNQISPAFINGLGYEWLLTNPVTGNSSVFSNSVHPTSIDPGTWGTFDITQVVESPRHCVDRKTLAIQIIPPVPVAKFEAVPPACAPYTVKFINSSLNANKYAWDFGDGRTSNLKDPEHLYADPGTYPVTLRIEGDGGTDTYPGFVTVHPMPKADFDVAPKFLWVGQALRAFNNTTHTTGLGIGYKVWYKWDWGDGSAVDTTENPSHIYRKAGKYDITLTTGTYTDPQCIDVRKKDNEVELENAGDIILPNTFKPWDTGPSDGTINSGGYQNNLFYPPVLSPTRKYHFVVYNRWGQLIFETEDPTKGWDGYFKGRMCDEGVYIYKIEGVFETGQSFSKMGDVLLLR